MEKIKNEYFKWKENVLKKSKEEIYNLSHEIRFYENIFYYIVNNEDDEDFIKNVKKQIGDCTLSDLYNKYKDMENPYNIESGEDINYFLEYCK